MEGVNSSMIYCRNFCECHNVPPAQNNMIIKKMNGYIKRVAHLGGLHRNVYLQVRIPLFCCCVR
jgi:hypothetical protein